MFTVMDGLLNRLMARVEFEPNTGCWLWSGGITGPGYGCIGIAGRVVRTHRLSWELHCGPIPDGLFVCHHCDTPPCLNPAHLFLGDAFANMQDMGRKGRKRGGGGGPGHPSGIAQPWHKLTPEQVVHIKTRELGVRAFARLYGVSPGHISAIQHGRWRAAA
jgi:hypothetical protein